MSETITEIGLDTFKPFPTIQTPSQQSASRQFESDVASIAVPPEISRSKASLIIVMLTGVSFLNTMGSGILTVALPTIAHDISLSPNLLLWPASIYALAAGCTLLVFGSIADVVGGKKIWLTGAGFYIVFTLACGLCKTGMQLIVFRTFLGVSISMCLPAAVGITTKAFDRGTRRNISFACQGMGQPLGYALGLILGGVFADTIGWRWGYYMSAIINFFLFLAAFWGLPPDEQNDVSWKRLGSDIDWIGAITLSVAFGLLSYVLAMITASYSRLGDPQNIALLTISLLLVPAFAYWMRRQERMGNPAIIPNSLWKNTAFTTTCVAVFFTWAVFNAFQYFSTLFFQNTQHLTALQTSLRFLPMVLVAALTDLLTGLLVSKIHVRILVSLTAMISLASSILMATVDPSSPYWTHAFAAMLLSAIGPDTLFTVSSLVITGAYPSKNGLAGGVFNVFAQLGNSIGLAVTAAVAAAVSARCRDGGGGGGVGRGQGEGEVLFEGYKAAFWICAASMAFVTGVTWWGLKGGGKVGRKSD